RTARPPPRTGPPRRPAPLARRRRPRRWTVLPRRPIAERKIDLRRPLPGRAARRCCSGRSCSRRADRLAQSFGPGRRPAARPPARRPAVRCPVLRRKPSSAAVRWRPSRLRQRRRTAAAGWLPSSRGTGPRPPPANLAAVWHCPDGLHPTRVRRFRKPHPWAAGVWARAPPRRNARLPDCELPHGSGVWKAAVDHTRRGRARERAPASDVRRVRNRVDFDVTIEIPKGNRNKYEVDHETGRIRLDRTLFTATQYPADYGFIENTLGEDGDPLDALVLVHEPTFPGCLITARAIGMFRMPDEKGGADEVVCAPTADPRQVHLRDTHPRPETPRLEIHHVYEVYRVLGPGKSGEGATSTGCVDAEEEMKRPYERYK